jgi:pilus retraction protein PilT
MNELLDAILRAAEENGASDILLHEGESACYKVSGGVVRAEGSVVDPACFDEIWRLSGADPAARDHDAALESPRGVRFRVNVFRHLGRRGSVLRRIQSEVPDLASLGLPADVLHSWLVRSSGLVLVCGPTGSGKSTTLASALDWMNQNFEKHIVTIEDPVEYVFSAGRSVITQREVGVDVADFAQGIRRALRQAPDVVFVGEIRDRESATIAIQASETGHLVLSTMHVSRASEAVERFALLFPQLERDAVGEILARELVGVLVQRLVPTQAGGVHVAVEYFTNVGAVSDLVAGREVEALADHLRKTTLRDALGFNQSLEKLVREGIISEDAAKAASPEPGDLTRALRGIR